MHADFMTRIANWRFRGDWCAARWGKSHHDLRPFEEHNFLHWNSTVANVARTRSGLRRLYMRKPNAPSFDMYLRNYYKLCLDAHAPPVHANNAYGNLRIGSGEPGKFERAEAVPNANGRNNNVGSVGVGVIALARRDEEGVVLPPYTKTFDSDVILYADDAPFSEHLQMDNDDVKK